MQHYRIRNGLLYATTRGGEDCLYIVKGDGINGETLRELMISEIHNKGHHSADRNLGYASEYIYCREMRKDFRDFVRQCDQCLANKERNTLPDGDGQTLPFPSEIVASYAIDFMGTFTKLKGQDSVLVVVDRAVGFSWLIPTSVTATAVQTYSFLLGITFLSSLISSPRSLVHQQKNDLRPADATRVRTDCVRPMRPVRPDRPPDDFSHPMHLVPPNALIPPPMHPARLLRPPSVPTPPSSFPSSTALV